MIILDTNVLSALMRTPGDETALAWLDGHVAAEIWTTAITVFEISYGIGIMASGRRRDALAAAFSSILSLELEDRVLPFDARASRCAADIAARRRVAGRPIDIQDIEIAGIAVAHGAAIATRNVRHFDDLDVEIINPWA